MSELLPCPFCGSADIEDRCTLTNTGLIGPKCRKCGATTPTADAWNRRRSWIPVTAATPAKAGRYLVGRQADGAEDEGESGEASWKPRLRLWRFPNCQMGFDVTHWMPLPAPPTQEEQT